MGINANLEMDYLEQSVEQGDIFILASDGVYEFSDKNSIINFINQSNGNLNQAARNIIDDALNKGSDDNLTIQIVLIDQIPQKNANEIARQIDELPFPPQLMPRMEFDGYKILREVHYSARSHVYLALDMETDTKVIIKAPSDDLKNDPVYLERLLMEEWIARRVDSAHVLKSYLATRKRNYLYIVTEYIEGITLTQWMHDNPNPNLDQVRNIVEQIAKGLRAFHRKEMLHQDLRPNNVMIDSNGIVKIIDFGSTLVAGLLEVSNAILPEDILGTAQYTAPEYFLGQGGNRRSDQFSLGVIVYQMLSGRLPYGTQVAKSKTKAAQNKLRYHSVLAEDREIPAWIDEAVRKAVHPDPSQRYQALSEFILDLHQPNKKFLNSTKAPLMERNPVLFWKSVSFILAAIIVFMIFQQHT
jgi:serine/threonine protein kinase